MPLLTLIRHAKSSWDYPELSDFERPLNERGRRDAPRLAARLARDLPRPSRLISSPATRALATARIFAEAWAVDFEQIQIEPRIYEASRKTLVELVRSLPDELGHVALFGHNPGLSELAQTLADCPFDEMPTCAVVHLQLEGRQWRQLAPGKGRLLAYLYPKDGLD
ncbi:MAG: histidine phosphatase family protein [Stagnimonas sp.]|nr:histidine phosphatase family protein [Stagnimonas sp.]